MLLRKFYDANPTDNGAAPVEVLTPELKQELETLRKTVSTIQPQKTPEELVREAEVDKVNFRQFSVANNLMKDEEFTRLDVIKTRSDRDLVFDDFASDWRKDNPTASADEISQAFNEQYHLNSENPTLKARGQKLLENEAKAIRSPLESNYQSAKSSYDENKMVRAEYPGFSAFIDDVIKENTPEKLTVKAKDKTDAGEEEVDVDVDTAITPEQRKEIEKMFSSPKNFSAYLSTKGKDKERTELKAKVARKIAGFLRVNNFEKAIGRAFEVGKGRGTKTGSSVGAEQPFAVIKNNETPKNPGSATVMQEIRESHDKLREKVGK